MRKSFFVWVLFAIGMNASAQGEWVTASIGNGATSTKVDLFIQASTNFDANKCDNLVFTIRIPISAGNNVTVTETFHASAFAHITFAITKYSVNDGSYYYYLVNGTGTVQAPAGTTITSTTFRVLELTFSGGSNGIVELVNLENDLPSNNGGLIRPQFYAQINLGDITNYTAMFYGTGGATPQNNANVNFDDWVPTAALVLLPVTLNSYDVNCTDKGVLINWSTASEQNTDRFEIQKSSNGSNWVVIGYVNAAGNSTTQKNYQYLDLNGGVAFYRIRQVDKDGRFVYTAIKRSDCKIAQYDVILYPVPANDKLNVVIRSDKTISAGLQVVDISGRIVQKNMNTINPGNNNIVINVSSLPAGQYLLVSTNPDLKIDKKFTILR